MKNKFLIICCFFNVAQYIEKCMGSIISQDYDNYKVIFVDDASTDGSLELIDDNEKFIKIKNKENLTALENIHNCILNYAENDDIIVILDGDDAFYGKKVLSYLNDFYNTYNCLITYGQALWTNGSVGFASAYSENEFKNLRKSPWRVSHLRTFRASVYKEIGNQDKTYSCMKDEHGVFYKMTYDVAIMFPIMEIAGFNKVKFIDKFLYIYNIGNPISDHRVNQELQTKIHMDLTNKPRFKEINFNG